MTTDWILGAVLLIVATPFIFVGYTEMVKKDQVREIEELIQIIGSKEKMTNDEKIFCVVAREHLNNLEKNK